MNNAGVEINGPFEDVAEDEWDKLYAVNVKGVFLGCKYVLPHMKQRRSGVIINIGSAVAVKGFPQFCCVFRNQGGRAADHAGRSHSKSVTTASGSIVSVPA